MRLADIVIRETGNLEPPAMHIIEAARAAVCSNLSIPQRENEVERVSWGLLDNVRLDRNALTKTAAALVKFILFEDRVVASELRPATAEETP